MLGLEGELDGGKSVGVFTVGGVKQENASGRGMQNQQIKAEWRRNQGGPQLQVSWGSVDVMLLIISSCCGF